VAQSISGTDLADTWAANSGQVAARVRCDWNKDGDYADTYEDITSRVLSVAINHSLYNQLSGLPLLGAGGASGATVVVDNEDRWFSPDNAAGLVGAYVGLAYGIYRIPIYIELGYYSGATPEYLVQFAGEIEGADESESYGKAQVVFQCKDNGVAIAQYKLCTTVTENALPDVVMADLLDDAGVAGYDLDTAMAEVPYSWLDDENVFEECQQLAQADGGMFYYGKGGEAIFRRMTAMLERDDSTTPQATLDEGNATFYRNSIAWRDCYSGVIAEWAGRYPGVQTELYRAPAPVEVAPGETVTEEARLRWPALSVVTPVYQVDYQAITSGPNEVEYGVSGVELTMTAYAQRADLLITNNLPDDTIYLTNLVVRGLPLLGEEAQQKRWDQTTALIDGEKVYPIRGNPYVQARDQVERVGAYMRDRLQRPRRLLSWRGPACPWLEMLDRVTLSHNTMTPNPGVDVECIVVGMSMSYSVGAMWQQELVLLPAADLFAYDDYFLIGAAVYADASSDKAGY
jgi:hypothetical protein